jgi:hypothetical protein
LIPSAPTPSFCSAPSKLGRIPKTPIEPVIVSGSAKIVSPRSRSNSRLTPATEPIEITTGMPVDLASSTA